MRPSPKQAAQEEVAIGLKRGLGINPIVTLEKQLLNMI
jgi:hypothetical protein